jgi:hypothetical protein
MWISISLNISLRWGIQAKKVVSIVAILPRINQRGRSRLTRYFVVTLTAAFRMIDYQETLETSLSYGVNYLEVTTGGKALEKRQKSGKV